MDKPYPFTKMRDFIVEHFDEGELASLLFGITGDDLAVLGTALTLPEFAQKMVSYFKRRDELPKLLDAMKRAREEPYARAFPEFRNPLLPMGGTAGDSEVKQREVEGINLPRVQKEGGYVIDEPPRDWIVEELTLGELMARKLGPLARQFSQAADADRFERREVLSVRSQAQLTVEFDPGQTRMNGRCFWQIVPEEQPVACLIIMPLERNSTPPGFVDKPFEQVFLTHLVPMFQIASLKSSSANTTKNTNRLRLTAETEQSIVNATVNGLPGQSLSVSQTVIGIQGYERDYLLLLAYISQATTEKAAIEKQVALLQALVDSFRIIKPTDLGAAERRQRELGDQRYERYMQLTAPGTIRGQLAILVEQWEGLDWDKADSKKKLARDVGRLRKAAALFAAGDQELGGLVAELGQVSKMSRGDIKAFLTSDADDAPELPELLAGEGGQPAAPS